MAKLEKHGQSMIYCKIRIKKDKLHFNFFVVFVRIKNVINK